MPRESLFVSEHQENLKLELYKMAVQIRNMEISLFWQRSNYFLVLNTAIAAGFFSLKNGDYTLLLSITGVVVSMLWVAVNLGSKFWQSRWEYRLNEAEKELSPNIHLFSASWETVQSDVKRSFEFRKRGPIHGLYQKFVLLKPSVTMMMTMLSVIFVVFWITASAIHFTDKPKGSLSIETNEASHCLPKAVLSESN